jgi:hypothetical protein
VSYVDAFIDRVAQLDLAPQPRDDHRSISDYPRMPPGTCHLSAGYLATTFPELAAVHGRLRFTVRGVPCEMEHSWNVRPDGQIVDSTYALAPETTNVSYWPD